jgi:uncharacterized phage protein (TIGR01671 family)
MGNREIKFRVWDCQANRWYGNLLDDEPPSLDSDMALSLNHELKIVEQYTGLRDRYGKEIYEGDVLKIAHGDPFCPESVCRVVEKMGSFGIVGSDFDHHVNKFTEGFRVFWPTYSPEVTEVIGNIHENP